MDATLRVSDKVVLSRLDALVKVAFAAVGIGAARLPVRRAGAFLRTSLSAGRLGEEDMVKMLLAWFCNGEERMITSMAKRREGADMRL